MGKTTEVNEKMNETSASISSASTSMEKSEEQNPLSDNKIQQESKKTKRDESSNPPGQVEAGPSQGSGVKEKASIHNLPPEMLTKILKCVDTRNLLKFRVVNRNWCAISSVILCHRSDAQICFELDSQKGFLWDTFPKTKKRLKDFLQCMKNCKNSPYSHFALRFTTFSLPSDVFDLKDFKEFLSDFSGSKIKGLQLRFFCMGVNDIEKLQFLIPKLGDFLLNKVPFVEVLSLDFPYNFKPPQLALFPTPALKQTATETKVNAVQFQLPHLKIIDLQTPMISLYPQIVTDLLNAAVNLTRIHFWATNLEDFQFLGSLGKFHLIREATIELRPEFFSTTKNKNQNKNNKNYCTPELKLPQLEILHLMMSIKDYGRDDEIFVAQATTFLTNLFESCKENLKEMTIEPVAFLSELQLPTFKNLRKLNISQRHYNQYCKQRIFPPGTRSKNIFPAVSDLGLSLPYWSKGFPGEDFIPILPSLKTLSLKDMEIKEVTISILASMCPNLKNFRIHKDDNNVTTDDDFWYDDTSPNLNLLKIGRAIWTHMKQLESLEIDIDMAEPANSSSALDSCFTGISEENCRRLYEMMKDAKTSKQRKLQRGIAERERMTQREHPSILDMKRLEKLTLNPYWRDKYLDRRQFLLKRLTWISQKYGFKQMKLLYLELWSD